MFVSRPAFYTFIIHLFTVIPHFQPVFVVSSQRTRELTCVLSLTHKSHAFATTMSCSDGVMFI